MFQWSITLTDKQVIMLAAFAASTPDKDGCQFHATHGMVGDAWDTRAVRKLEEMNLIQISHFKDEGRKPTVWSITDKGRMIASAIQADAVNLQKLSGRKGIDSMYEINRIGRQKWKEKQQRKKERAKVK